MTVADLPPRRQHPTWIFLSAVRQLRGLALPVVVLLVTGGRRGEGWILGAGGLLVVLGVVARAVAWWQFRYEVSGGELRVYSGFLERKERLVPLERIQAVDVSETPLQRLFGVVGVRIETAAGGVGAADVSLEAVTRAEADLLRHRLAVARGGPAVTPDGVSSEATAPAAAIMAGDAGQLVRRITPGELVVAGATSGRIGPAMAVVAFAFQLVDDVLPEAYWERFAVGAAGLTLRSVVTIAVIVGAGAWLLAIAGTFLTFGGFELRRDGDRLLIAHGLLDRRRRSIPLARIQAVTVTEGLVRRWFGLAAVRFESAGYGTDTAESGVLFPLLRRSEAPPLLAAATPGFAVSLDPKTLASPPPRARGRYLLADVWGLLGFTAVTVIVAAVAPWWRWEWGLLPLAATPLAVLHGLLSYRDAGWAFDPEARLIVRNGGWARVTTIMPRRRLQRCSLDQSLLQRRVDLASFAASVASGGAGGRVRLEHLDATVAFDLMARLGPVSTRPTPPAADSVPAVAAPAPGT